MSAIAGWVSARREPSRELLAAMLSVMARRGSDRAHVRLNGSCGLGASRFAWECGEGFAGHETVLQSNGLLVAADATLYYRDDLARKLGPLANGGTVSHLIAAAYRRWGADFAEHLEGDFAVVIWDAKAGRLVVARDFGGARPLYYAVNADRLAVASSASALLEDPNVSAELNPAILAAGISAMLSAAGPETSLRDVKVVPAGHTLVWTAEAGPRVTPHWSPPRWKTDRSKSFRDAAAELRALLIAASRERLSPTGVTASSLSGGWDSPSVFGTAQAALAEGGFPGQVLPVSMSYPEGDPGREDEFIELIADHWDVPVRWSDAYAIPILDDSRSSAGSRDLPWAHLYEHWNRRLGTEARALDARVLLTGYGGDQLFQVSDVYLADLFRGLRWSTLYREWQTKPGKGFKPFFRWAIRPNLGPVGLEVARLLRRGRPLAHPFDRDPPSWIREDFARRVGLVERERQHMPTRALRNRAEAEAHWFLTEPFFPRVNSAVAEFALEAGVELRSPLYDSRVIEFQATRPWSDRASQAETKRLLRAAVEGLVPEQVLAPRTTRTGVTGAYAVSSVHETVTPVLERLLEGPLLLADLGVVEPGALAKALERMRADAGSGLEHPIFLTTQAELWLRGREHSGDSGSDEPKSVTRSAGAVHV